MHNSEKQMQMEAKNGKQFMDIESTKDSEKIFSFFVHKRKLSSEFDHKGAKQFLNEKQKALEEIILNDEINLVVEKKCKRNKDVKNNAHCHHGHQGKNKNRLMPIEIEHFPTFGENDDDKNIFICIGQ